MVLMSPKISVLENESPVYHHWVGGSNEVSRSRRLQIYEWIQGAIKTTLAGWRCGSSGRVPA
jgi:hypothetical protein